MKFRALTILALLSFAGCDCNSDPAIISDSSVDVAATDAGLRDGAAVDSAGSDGAIVDVCPGLSSRCGDVCVVTSVDPSNCGGCGVACTPAQVCFSSGCAADCPRGLDACDGTCVDTDIDNANCGMCGTACGAGEGCVGGSCEPAVIVGPDPAKCEGGGPPITIVDGRTVDMCAGRTAAVSFTYGLCSCGDVGLPRLSSETLIDAYDSAMGPYVPEGGGGSLGANGMVATTELEVTGDLRSGGPGGVNLRRTDIGQQLWVSENVSAEEVVDVVGDAYVGGEFSGENITIGGTLRTPDCGAVPGGVTSGMCESTPVVVEPPCACEPADILPIGDIVAFRVDAANNDNALIGLDASVFEARGGPRRLDLPCGHYFLTEISGAVTIVAHGRTALYVSGDVDASASMVFSVDPASTIDVFVGGTLHAEASLTVGSPAYPSNVRFYIGGTDDSFDPPRSVDLESDVDLAGLFYAPNGAVVSSSTLEMYGAVFAGEFHNSSSTIIHYDRAATRLGEDCPDDTPDGCTSCRDCGNQACIDGMCGSCTMDSECCSPLRCMGGMCVPELI